MKLNYIDQSLTAYFKIATLVALRALRRHCSPQEVQLTTAGYAPGAPEARRGALHDAYLTMMNELEAGARLAEPRSSRSPPKGQAEGPSRSIAGDICPYFLHAARPRAA